MATDIQIEQVRRAIGDSKKTESERFISDGFEKLFSLAYKNVFDVAIYTNSTLLDKEAYTVLNDAGKIVFNEAIDVNNDIVVTYAYAGYMSEQISELIDIFGVEGAIVESLKGLVADSAKFYDYSQGQTSDKRSQIYDHLKDMLATAKAELVASTTPDLAIGNRNTVRRDRRYALDLTRDDTFSTTVDGYSSNNA